MRLEGSKFDATIPPSACVSSGTTLASGQAELQQITLGLPATAQAQADLPWPELRSQLIQILNKLPPPAQPLPPPGKFADGRVFTDKPLGHPAAPGNLWQLRMLTFGSNSESVLPLADFMHVQERIIYLAKGCAVPARISLGDGPSVMAHSGAERAC